MKTKNTVVGDLDRNELHSLGWWHEDELPDPDDQDEDELFPELMTLPRAVLSLHRQAHPGQHASVAMCREEPCRRLSLDQLRALPLTP